MHLLFQKVKVWAVIGWVCLLASCTDKNTLYKAHEDIERAEWFVENSPSFKVEVTDISKEYNIYYLIRNGIQYPYNNLYLTRKVSGPDEELISEELVELMISDPETGEPYGEGLGDLFDQKIVLWKNYKFEKPGVYTFSLTQAMRQNPLPNIVSVGLSVEYANPVVE